MVDNPQTADWRAAGLRYYSLSHFLKRRFGHRVWKLSVDAGFGCPNVDGTLGTRGCTFCNVESFSPSRRVSHRSIADQVDRGIRWLKCRHKAERFLAYFQPGTNTHGPPELLRQAFTEAIAHPDVVGLIVGTRPDCAGDEVLDLLEDLAGRTWLSVEYGLQTIHDRTLDQLNRGHRYDAFLDAVERSRARGLEVGAHVILGLPGETPDDMHATARELARLEIGSVKLHNLYVSEHTQLARALESGELRLPDRDQYVRYVVDFLERLHPTCVIDRLTAEVPREYLLAPDWCINKLSLLQAIDRELLRRDTYQGRKYTRPVDE